MKNRHHFFLLILIFGCTNSIQVSNETLSSKPEITEAELLSHIKYLSADERTGRFPGTQGSKEAIDYISNKFKSSDVTPAGTDGFLQPFEFITGIKVDNTTRLTTGLNSAILNKDFIPLEFSSNGKFEGSVVFVGYGFVIED